MVLTYCPLCLLACRAATKDLHSCLFWASFCIELQVCFMAFSSFSTVQRQVSLGRPLFRLPSGVQCRAVFVISSCSFRMMCPIHLHRLLVMMVSILSWLVRASNCWLEMVLGQKIRMIILRFLVWNAEILERSFSVILQHSELYSKVERTQLWYSLSLVLMLYFVDFHTLFIILNVFLALLSRLLMSLPVPPSYLTMLPRYENSSVAGIFIPFICIGGGFCVF